ncbi:hypothetical protein GGE07_001527 [Sinorhizobium terangae]|nr:hypothetical protein [Sinorhizobium terangae]
MTFTEIYTTTGLVILAVAVAMIAYKKLKCRLQARRQKRL